MEHINLYHLDDQIHPTFGCYSINGTLKKKFHYWHLDYIIEHKKEKNLQEKILLMLLICYGMIKQL